MTDPVQAKEGVMLYVYGIVDSQRFETIPGEGHEAGDITPIPCGALAAAVSVLSSSTIERTPQSVWRHERVLERLMQDHAVLPLRFGAICRDAQVLRECLFRSSDGLVKNLERVRGMVEMALRIVEDDRRHAELPPGFWEDDRLPNVDRDTGDPVGRGTAYLRGRLQRRRREQAREDEGRQLEHLLRQQLHAVSKDVICAVPADASAGFVASCLVERDRVTDFAATLERFRGHHPQFDVSCTGPWAPYSFVAVPPVWPRAS